MGARRAHRTVAEPHMAKSDPQARVRLPPDAMAFVKAEAREAASSQNSVIVRAIRAAMKAKGPAGAGTPPGPDHGNPLGKEEANERASA